MRFPCLILNLLVLLPSLSGCTQLEQDCFNVPWPAEGTQAKYESFHHGTGNSFSTNFTVTGQGEVLRGDGHRAPSLIMHRGNSESYVSLEDRLHLGGSASGFDYYHLNFGDAMFGALAFGTCFDDDTTLVGPYLDPAQNVTVEVVERGRDLLVLEVRTPPRPEDNGVMSALHHRLIWQSQRPFVDETRSFSPAKGWQEPILSHKLIDQAWEPREREPRELSAPALHFRHRESTNCLAAPARHPDLGPLDLAVPFDRFVRAATADQALQDYLGVHQEACALVTSYAIIDEPNSTAYVWTSVYGDNTTEHYRKQFVVRCFRDPAWQALYGECETRDRYSQDDEVGTVEGIPADPSRADRVPGVGEALENFARFTDEPFSRFVWRAQSAAGGPLAPLIGLPGEGGIDISVGKADRSVRYIGQNGVEPTGQGSWEEAVASATESGWILHFPADHMTEERVFAST